MSDGMLRLSDIVGQDEAVAKLRTAVRCERMPHAYLFVGPAGVGRGTTALAFARMLLCETPSDDGACGACEACRLVQAGTHPDLHLITKELARYHDDAAVRARKMQELSIEVIRSFLIDPAWLSSAYGRGKVFIIREAELMSDAAQNALLKTLEEPPPDVRLILIATQSEQMLPTTRSRCTLVRFTPLPEQVIAQRLAAEGVAGAEAAFWARFCDGSLGEAIALSRRGLYPVKSALLARLADPDGGDGLGGELSDAAEDLAQQLIQEAKQDQGAELAKTLASRQASAAILRLIAGAYRDALRAGVGAEGALTNTDQPDVIRALTGRFNAEALGRILQQLCTYESLLWRNVNPRAVWENVAITCTAAQSLGIG